VQALDGHTIWPVEALIAKNGGKAPRSMSSFQSLVKRMGKPPQPVEAPEKLPSVSKDCLGSAKEYLFGGMGDVPSLKDLGLDEPPGKSPFRVCIFLFCSCLASVCHKGCFVGIICGGMPADDHCKICTHKL
jgi:hypothetical protein